MREWDLTCSEGWRSAWRSDVPEPVVFFYSLADPGCGQSRPQGGVAPSSVWERLKMHPGPSRDRWYTNPNTFNSNDQIYPWCYSLNMWCLLNVCPSQRDPSLALWSPSGVFFFSKRVFFKFLLTWFEGIGTRGSQQLRGQQCLLFWAVNKPDFITCLKSVQNSA